MEPLPNLPSSAVVARQPLTPNGAMRPSDTAIRTLWVRMLEFYGHKWSSAYGETPEEGAGGTWQSGLTGVTTAQMADGLRACLQRTDPWPPTLPEFYHLCVPPAPAVKPWQHRQADPAKKPSAERLAWHEANIAWIKRGGELPRPDVVEPPAPRGCLSLWEIYRDQFGLPVVDS